jgi:hypothetical protein
MKKIILSVAILLTACNTAQKTSVINYAPPTSSETTVTIWGANQIVPINAKLLGTIEILDGGFTTDCDYATVIAQAINQTRRLGGNCLVITKHTTPGLLKGTCHQITGLAYLLHE